MNLDKFKNKLIVFEGSDVTGKTTIAKMLNEKLNESGIDSVFTFQPGDAQYGVHGQLFRSMCIDKRWDLHPLTNFFLFFADKVEQCSKIVIPALEAGKTVISDRWWYSTHAYQYLGKKVLEKYSLDKEFGDNLNMLSVLGLKPNYVFYFPNKLNVKIEKDQNDQFETADSSFYSRVNKGYEELADELNFVKVNSSGGIEATLNRILLV